MGNVSIETLKPHPFNTALYSPDPAQDEELMALVKEHGIVEPIIINPQNFIVSGNRRYHAALKLKMDTVPVKVKSFKSIDDEIEFLILANQYRSKTIEERIREGKKLAEISVKRGNGRARDQIGEKIGMSGKTFKKGEKVVDEIDRIAETDPERAAKLRAELNHSVSGAARAVEEEEDENAPVTEGDVIDEKAFNEELKKAEERRTLFYVHELKYLLVSMGSTYRKLAAKRTPMTPRAVGHMIGNIKDMMSRLQSWMPENMIACENCGGTGRVKIEDSDKTTICDVCVNGRAGYYKPSDN